MRQFAKKATEKLSQLSAVSLISLLLVTGFATAATVSYFATVEGDVTANTPVSTSSESGLLSSTVTMDGGESAIGSVVEDNSADVPINVDYNSTVTYEKGTQNEEVDPASATVRHIVGQGLNIRTAESDGETNAAGYKAKFQHSDTNGVEFHVKGSLGSGDDIGYGKLEMQPDNTVTLDNNFDMTVDYRTGDDHGHSNQEKNAPDWVGLKVDGNWYTDFSADFSSSTTQSIGNNGGEDISLSEFSKDNNIGTSLQDDLDDNTITDNTVTKVKVGSGTSDSSGSGQPSDIYYSDVKVEGESLFTTVKDDEAVTLEDAASMDHILALTLDQDADSGSYDVETSIAPTSN